MSTHPNTNQGINHQLSVQLCNYWDPSQIPTEMLQTHNPFIQPGTLAKHTNQTAADERISDITLDNLLSSYLTKII